MLETKSERAVKLWDSGKSVDEIAEALGVTQKKAREYLNREGVEIDDKPIDPNGRKATLFAMEWENVTRIILGGTR